jgi:two-component system, chemotaxis family, chemotaxis protein CheY
MPAAVLIVDDSPATRMVVRRMLVISGLEFGEFHYARNGADALSTLRQTAIDLIITDVNMDGMDGESLLRQLANDGNMKRIPALVISSDSTNERAHRMLSLGAKGYLTKPFNPEQLREAVARILEGAHA